jgi:hypothetical protein
MYRHYGDVHNGRLCRGYVARESTFSDTRMDIAITAFYTFCIEEHHRFVRW